MTTNENLEMNDVLRDSAFQEKKSNSVDVEVVKGDNGAEVVDKLQRLESALSHDTPITAEQIQQTEKTLGSVNVNFGGEEMTIERMQIILEENTEIWEEIKKGDDRHASSLTYITDEIAECLLSKGGQSGWLLLHKLTHLSDRQAEIISEYRGEYIALPAITSLSNIAVKHLSMFKGEKELGVGLVSLTDEAAEHLSKYVGKQLNLDRLTILTDTAAKNLSEFDGELSLCRLDSLSDAAAEYLGKHQGGLDLRGLTTISDDGIKKLSKQTGDIGLGLATVSDEAAEDLSKIDADNLHLSNLVTVSDVAIDHLAHFTGLLGLDRLESLSDEAAKSLSKHKNTSLCGLKTLSDTAAKYFATDEVPYVRDEKIKAQIAKFKK